MNYSDIIAIIALAISIVSGLFSIYTYFDSAKQQKKCDTIEAFSKLQNEVLDNLASFSKAEIEDAVKNRFKPEYKEIYADYRVLVARCEHFAVGLNENVYDFIVFDKLGGLHIIYLYQKIKPIIKASREASKEEKPYEEFEKLYNRLLRNHPQANKK